MANGQAAQAAAEKLVAAGDAEVARERADYHERMKGRPTPTQHECDLIKVGAPPAKKEPDGAGPGVTYGFVQRQATASTAAPAYQTRASRVAPPRPSAE